MRSKTKSGILTIKNNILLKKNSVKNNNNSRNYANLSYLELSQEDLNGIRKILITFNDVILSMIRNAVFVLPNSNGKNNFPSLNSFLKIQENINDFKYDELMNTKKIMLFGIKNIEKKMQMDNAITRLVVDKQNKIRCVCKKSFYYSIGDIYKSDFLNDIKKIEKVVNDVNLYFKKLLPEAKICRQNLLNKIRKDIIPKKARYLEKDK